jgi:hypothetical protein
MVAKCGPGRKWICVEGFLVELKVFEGHSFGTEACFGRVPAVPPVQRSGLA